MPKTRLEIKGHITQYVQKMSLDTIRRKHVESVN